MGAHMKVAGGLLLLLAIAGCATGPNYTDVMHSLPQMAGGSGRIYFYRSGGPFGAGIQPSVMLNGVKVGDSKPGGVFFVDRPPGNYEVNLTTEVERKLTFTLDAGQTRYVRMTVGLGVIVYRVYPELVDKDHAEAELLDLKYTGTIAPGTENKAATPKAGQAGAVTQTSVSRPATADVSAASSGSAPSQSAPADSRSSTSRQTPASMDDLKDLMPQK